MLCSWNTVNQSSTKSTIKIICYYAPDLTAYYATDICSRKKRNKKEAPHASLAEKLINSLSLIPHRSHLCNVFLIPSGQHKSPKSYAFHTAHSPLDRKKKSSRWKEGKVEDKKEIKVCRWYKSEKLNPIIPTKESQEEKIRKKKVQFFSSVLCCS